MGCLGFRARHHLAHYHVAEGVGEFDAAVDRPVGYVATAGVVMVGLLAHGFGIELCGWVASESDCC